MICLLVIFSLLFSSARVSYAALLQGSSPSVSLRHQRSPSTSLFARSTLPRFPREPSLHLPSARPSSAISRFSSSSVASLSPRPPPPQSQARCPASFPSASSPSSCFPPPPPSSSPRLAGRFGLQHAPPVAFSAFPASRKAAISADAGCRGAATLERRSEEAAHAFRSPGRLPRSVPACFSASLKLQVSGAASPPRCLDTPVFSATSKLPWEDGATRRRVASSLGFPRSSASSPSSESSLSELAVLRDPVPIADFENGADKREKLGRPGESPDLREKRSRALAFQSLPPASSHPAASLPLRKDADVSPSSSASLHSRHALPERKADSSASSEPSRSSEPSPSCVEGIDSSTSPPGPAAASSRPPASAQDRGKTPYQSSSPSRAPSARGLPCRLAAFLPPSVSLLFSRLRPRPPHSSPVSFPLTSSLSSSPLCSPLFASSSAYVSRAPRPPSPLLCSRASSSPPSGREGPLWQRWLHAFSSGRPWPSSKTHGWSSSQTPASESHSDASCSSLPSSSPSSSSPSSSSVSATAEREAGQFLQRLERFRESARRLFRLGVSRCFAFGSALNSRLRESVLAQAAVVLAVYFVHFAYISQQTFVLPVQLLPNRCGLFQHVQGDSLAGWAALALLCASKSQAFSNLAKNEKSKSTRAAMQRPYTPSALSSSSSPFSSPSSQPSSWSSPSSSPPPLSSASLSSVSPSGVSTPRGQVTEAASSRSGGAEVPPCAHASGTTDLFVSASAAEEGETERQTKERRRLLPGGRHAQVSRKLPWHGPFPAFLKSASLLLALLGSYVLSGYVACGLDFLFYFLHAAGVVTLDVAMHRALQVLLAHLAWVFMGVALLRLSPITFFQSAWEPPHYEAPAPACSETAREETEEEPTGSPPFQSDSMEGKRDGEEPQDQTRRLGAEEGKDEETVDACEERSARLQVEQRSCATLSSCRRKGPVASLLLSRDTDRESNAGLPADGNESSNSKRVHDAKLPPRQLEGCFFLASRRGEEAGLGGMVEAETEKPLLSSGNKAAVSCEFFRRLWWRIKRPREAERNFDTQARQLESLRSPHSGLKPQDALQTSARVGCTYTPGLGASGSHAKAKTGSSLVEKRANARWFTVRSRGKGGLWVWPVISGYLISCLFFNLTEFLNDALMSFLPEEPQGPTIVQHIMNPTLNTHLSFLVGALAPCLSAPGWEELLYRGFCLPLFSQVMPLSLAAVLSSLLFAVHHMNVQTVLPLWVLGLTWTAVYVHSKNLLTTVLIHAMWNSRIFLGNLFGC
ncbi:CAAX amino terminal protease family protein [Toxoplasma gondii RUB]|uniref:CAAX amino terminal protease family protein n=1 Tax=Toxoplasma gondii RUB TaxID=935652 RepID=A0A086LM05_TOXGO|nr:CAAX amino terminal protease family protein [Toxoplasma gondii RUB]